MIDVPADEDNRTRPSQADAHAGGGARPKAGQRRGATFKRVDRVLGAVATRLGLDTRLKEHAIMSLWPVIAGPPWDARTRALFVDCEGNLVVAVADSSTGQELSMLKKRFIDSLRAASRSIGLEVKGLRLDLKHFHSATETLPLPQFQVPRKPSEAELSAVALSDDELMQIVEMKSNLDASAVPSSVSSERIAALFERDLRMKRWQRQQGFPLCSRCGLPSPVLLSDDLLCPACHYGGD